jgi:hypothetical protein
MLRTVICAALVVAETLLLAAGHDTSPAAAAQSATAGYPASAERAASRRCNNVVVRDHEGNVYTQTNGLWAIKVRCRKARRVARHYLTHSEGNADPVRPYGFRCRGGEDGVSCRKGTRIVTWGWYYD